MKILKLTLILVSSIILSACGPKKSTDDLEFSADEELTEAVTPYADQLASQKINIIDSRDLNQDFSVNFQTRDPDGAGNAYFKAKSIKTVDAAGLKTPSEGKKLVLLEISIKGDPQNKGNPSTFNQIGDNPSPQFVLVDKDKNQTWVEETYYSDGYTQSNDLFELSKITLDHDKWVQTAIVFEIDQDQTVDLAFRFINPDGQVDFYDINQ